MGRPGRRHPRNAAHAPRCRAGRPGRAQPDWSSLIAGALADLSLLSLVFQRIVSLQDAVIVVYEALSRFDGPPGLTPDR